MIILLSLFKMYKYSSKKIMITIDSTSILNLLDSKLAECLLLIIKQTNKNTYTWYSTKGNRNEISSKLEISPATVNRYIIILKNKNILRFGDYSARGEYKLNKIGRAHV